MARAAWTSSSVVSAELQDQRGVVCHHRDRWHLDATAAVRAPPNDEQALGFEDAHRVAHGGASDVEVLHQHRLGGQQLVRACTRR